MNIIFFGLIGFLSGGYFNKLSLFLVSVLGGYAMIENVDSGIENTISLVKTELTYVLTGWIMGSIWNNISLLWILLGIQSLNQDIFLINNYPLLFPELQPNHFFVIKS